MSDKAKLKINDSQIDLNLIKGSENEIGIDISSLRSKSNVITLDPGYKNTGSCQSSITFLDGEKGILRYRGYSIEELAKKADFLEVAYLLIFGELPNKQQLEKLSNDIKERAIIDEDLRIILNSFPKSAHPMGILSSLTSGLVAFDPSAVDIDDEEDMYDAILNLLAKIPVLVAWVYRRRKGLPLEYGDTSLGYVENLAKMMFQRPNKEYVQNDTITSALNKLLILHADHEQNCYVHC
jgi:citrate synthase